MISGTNSPIFHVHFSSSPASAAPQHASQETANERSTTESSPVPDSSQRVNKLVSGQEGQASKPSTQNARPNPQINADSQGKNQGKSDNNTASGIHLSDAELKQIEALRQRDREVRAHEAAHLAAAGQYATGGATFTLARGPDGRNYAVGGSVGIDTSAEADPADSLRKAEQIQRAALAPAEPSGQDRAVAAAATQLKLKAQADIATQQREETLPQNPKTDGGRRGEPVPDALRASDADIGKSVHHCAVCGGSHPTEPHLRNNQHKVNQYIAS